MTTKYENLQRAVKDYGAAAFENLCRCRRFGDAVLSGYAQFLGCAQDLVAGVPAEGPFDPRRDYGEAAYSFHGQQLILLAPVTFGVSLIVRNIDAPGGVWLRTPVSVEVTGDTYDVFVGERPILRVPVDFDGKLEPVWQAICDEMRARFEQGVETFRDDRGPDGIGFLLE